PLEGVVDLVEPVAFRERAELRLRAARGAAEEHAVVLLHGATSLAHQAARVNFPGPLTTSLRRRYRNAMWRPLDVATSLAATLLRVGAGLNVDGARRQPARLLELYEFEGCPYCRKVREALSILDLDALVYPCPKGGPRHRERVRARGGRLQFPWLVDPNTGTALYESDDIVRYLFTTYGSGEVPAVLSFGLAVDVSSMLPSAARRGQPLPCRTHAGRAARAVELRGLALLSHRARGAVRTRAPLRAPQRRQGQHQTRCVRRASGTDDGAVPRRSEHGPRHVRVG